MDARYEPLLDRQTVDSAGRTTMKKLTPEQRREIARILGEIRSDLAEMRQIFERIRDRLDAQA